MKDSNDLTPRAVDPNNPATLVAAVSDFALGGYNGTKWTISRDNGASWAENYVPFDPTFGFLATSDGNFWLANSDPTVAIEQWRPDVLDARRHHARV